MKHRMIPIILVCVAVLAGCEGPQRDGLRPPAPTIDVQEFSLSSSPTALNWDDQPGPDGIIARIQFFQVGPGDNVKSVTVKGTVEFLLFDGRVSGADLAKAKPTHTWAYKGNDLPTYLGKQMGMWAYQVQLDWRAKPPKASVVTVIARWQPPGGDWRYSDPTFVAVSLK